MRSPGLVSNLAYIAVWAGLTVFLVLMVRKMVNRLIHALEVQSDAVHKALVAQNFMGLIQFLEDSKIREARKVVLNKLAGQQDPPSDELERDAAFLVCATYDVAGILVRHDIIPAPPFVTNWGPSIIKCHDALKPFIDSLGPERWDDFSWLREQAAAHRQPKDVTASPKVG
jgi:hypothetical protein